MTHEDMAAKLRREYRKRIDYQLVDKKVAAIYEEKALFSSFFMYYKEINNNQRSIKCLM